MLNHYYLDITLQTECLELTEAFFKQHILTCVQEVFGLASEACYVDLLKFDLGTLSGLIRVPADYYVKVRAALTLVASYKGYPAYFKINKASPLLLSLQGDSREYIH